VQLGRAKRLRSAASGEPPPALGPPPHTGNQGAGGCRLTWRLVLAQGAHWCAHDCSVPAPGLRRDSCNLARNEGHEPRRGEGAAWGSAGGEVESLCRQGCAAAASRGGWVPAFSVPEPVNTVVLLHRVTWRWYCLASMALGALAGNACARSALARCRRPPASQPPGME
jgi:hypothetical protein